MSYVQGFGTAALPAAEVIGQYDKLYAPARSGKLDDTGCQQFSDLGKRLSEILTLEPIMPGDQDLDLQAQLVDKDLVHVFGARSIDELKEYRLGSTSSNKTAFALVNPQAEGGRQILAAIYTYWQHEKPQDYIRDFADLAGNVSSILNSRIMPQRPAAERAAIFYSISTFGVMNGAGQMLIDRLHARLTGDLDSRVVLSTLSPLRGFSEWLEKQGADRGSFDEQGLKQAALTFLLANKDGVQRFHMGNGATPVKINLAANDAGSLDDVNGCNIMVNYMYSRIPSVIAANRQNYARACQLQKSDETAAMRLIYDAMAPTLQAEVETLIGSQARSPGALLVGQPKLQA